MKTCNRAYEEQVFEITARELRTRSVALTPVPTYPDSIVYQANSVEASVMFKAVDPQGRDRDAIREGDPLGSEVA